jgi:7,8-dihydro-6-hydroxymethylpterin-pyrophosphokinase
MWRFSAVKAWVGLGSNLGDRRANLERAAKLLLEYSGATRLQAAPIVTSPALIPPGAPQDWNKPYLNSVIGLDWPERV